MRKKIHCMNQESLVPHVAPLPDKVNIVHLHHDEHKPIFDDLLSALQGGLAEAGVPVQLTENECLPGYLNLLVGATIFMSSEALRMVENKRYVVYQLEPLSSHDGFLASAPEYLQLLRSADGVWDYSATNMGYLRAIGVGPLSLVRPGYHASLEKVNRQGETDIDVLFFGSLSLRRRTVLSSLRALGLRVHTGFGVYGEERNRLIARARIVLNMHQHDTLNQLEEVRLSFLLANRCFVISESADVDPYDGGVIFAPYDQLVKCCTEYLAAGQAVRDEIAQRGYESLKACSMGHAAARALGRFAAKSTPRLAYKRRTGICLNMIVKNETPVLDRLFRSLKEVIDYYVIVDTGSDDGTPEFIERWMGEAGIPGEVHRREWVNFGVNREQALQLAVAAGKGDWLLLIDADEELACSDRTVFESLTAGVTYELEKHHGSLRYALPNLIDIRANQWCWRAPVHEYLAHCSGPGVRKPLKDVWIIYHAGQGVRSRGKTDEQKYLADASLLEAQLAQDPADARSRFYLAQSYRDAGRLREAREHYLQRAGMTNGWIEEQFFSQFQAGRLARQLELPDKIVIGVLLAALRLRPSRAEPLHELAVYCRHHKRWGEAFAFASMGALLPSPADRLFVQHDVYQWKLLDELCVSAFWAGFFEESRDAACMILHRVSAQGINVPPADLERIRENLRFANSKIA